MMDRKHFYFLVGLLAATLGIAIVAALVAVGNMNPQAHRLEQHLGQQAGSLLPFLVGIVVVLMCLLGIKNYRSKRT